MNEELKKEICEMIDKQIYDFMDKDYHRWHTLYKSFKENLEDYYTDSNKIHSELKEIKEMIYQHAIGVQNVYNEFELIQEKFKRTKAYYDSFEVQEFYRTIYNFRNDIENLMINFVENIRNKY